MPYLTPDSIPADDICRPLLIPNSEQWLALVSGAVSELAKDWNWEQFGSVTPEEAAERMLTMLNNYYDDSCSGSCARIYRVGIGGAFEQSDDGGETWEAPTGDATVPPVPEREEPTADERKCLAAANAANVLALTYEQMLDAWQLDHEIDYGISVFGAAVVGLIGVWLGILSVGAINLALGVFATAYEILDNLTQDAWDEDFNERLICILLEAAVDTAGVVTFQYDLFLTRLGELVTANPIEQALLVAQVNYMMLWIGEDGLNAAGATTGITTHECNCDNTWCYEFDFLIDEQNWESWVRVTNAGAVYVSGQGWRAPSTPQGSSYATRNIHISIDIPTDARVTEIVFYRNLQATSVAGALATVDGSTLLAFNEQGVTGSDRWYRWFVDAVTNFVGVQMDTTVGGSSGLFSSMRIVRARLSGIGDNPFGSDNC